MGVHWTPSWSSILHLLLHIAILQNVWQLFCIHLTSKNVKHDHLQKWKNNTTHQCWRPVGSSRTIPHPPADGRHANRDQVLVGNLAICSTSISSARNLSLRAWRPCERRKFTMLRLWLLMGPTPPRAQYSYQEEQNLEDVFSGSYDDNWELAEIVKFLKVFNWSQKWKMRSKIEFGLFWMRDKGI